MCLGKSAITLIVPSEASVLAFFDLTAGILGHEKAIERRER